MEVFKDFYVSKILRVNSFCHSKPITINNNNQKRSFYSLIYKKSGKTIYHFKGNKFISDSSHVVFLPKNQPYIMQCIEPGQCIMIDFELVNNIDIFYSFIVTDSKKISQTFESINKIWVFKKNNCTTEILGSLYSTLNKLFALQELSLQSKNKLHLIASAIDYIENNFTNSEISNELLAEKCNLSVVYFRKLFTETFCMSPMKYVHDLRISKAKDMLMGTCNSVSLVAENVGFCNIYSFSRSFKKATGVSPNNYVKLLQEKG